MPVPNQTDRPLRRPASNLIIGAQWIGADDDLALEVQYYDAAGSTAVISFQTRNAGEGNPGVICLPSSATIAWVPDEALAASLKMAAWLGGAVPGSYEFAQTFEVATAGENAKGFQTAAGTTEVQEVRIVSDALIEIDFKIKGNSTIKTLTRGYAEFTNYAFQPETQLACIPGSVKAQFPSYQHDYPGTTLSSSQKQDILSYVANLAVWC